MKRRVIPVHSAEISRVRLARAIRRVIVCVVRGNREGQSNCVMLVKLPHARVQPIAPPFLIYILDIFLRSEHVVPLASLSGFGRIIPMPFPRSASLRLARVTVKESIYIWPLCARGFNLQIIGLLRFAPFASLR